MSRPLAIVAAALLVGCASDAPTPSAAPKRAFDNFVAHPERHAWQNSYLLALTCKYAPAKEADRAAFSKRMRAMGIRRIDFFSHSVDGLDVEAAVVSNDDIIIIVFRDSGTKTPIELVNDWLLAEANLRMVPDKRYGIGARLHGGLARVVEGVRKEIGRQARDHGAGQGKSLWFTGHGVSGALATIGGAAAVQAGFAVAGVSSFGAPRPGNERFALAYAEQKFECQRWVYDNDLVPTVPHDLTLGYRHAGTLFKIREDGFIRIGAKEERVPGDIKKHDIDFYIKAIGKKLPDGVRTKIDAK
jgi:triacylglycerol lipase